MTNLKTDPGLLEKIKQLASYRMTPEDIFEQKVSFVYGQLGSVSKEQVRKLLRDGQKV